MNYAELYEPHTPEQYAALRESIIAHGITDAILLAPDGTIVNGHTRAAIAAELGIECPSAVAVAADEGDLLERLVLANGNRRALKGEHRAAVVNALRARGWPNVRIAEVLALEETTVRRSPTARSAKADPIVEHRRITRSDGTSQPAHKATPAQARARQAAVKAYTEQGWATPAIARALDVSVNTVSKDRGDLGLPSQRNVRPLREGVPPPVAWWQGEAVPEPKRHKAATPPPPEAPEDAPRWLASTVMRHVGLLSGIIRERGGFNMLAWDVHGAVSAGDEDWLNATADALGALASDLSKLKRVVSDEDYRRTVMAPGSLRAV